jgi:predicted DNA-binding transcriptional regulator AlpA
MDDRERFLTTAEVARLARAPESTVRYWRQCGRGPRGFKIGRRVVYRLEEVEAWISRCDAGDTDAYRSG